VRGLWLVLAAALLALCHGCHGEDIDDELFGGGWWVAGGV
jgi:hypothetical protein